MPDASKTKLLRSTPVLKSADYARSRAFYAGVLGYRVVEEGGDPPRFGIFDRDKSTLFVDAWNGPPGESEGGWQAYIHVDGVDTVADVLKGAGAPITRPLENTVYGMREFEVTDPDGNVLCFGQDVDEAARS